MTHEFDTKARDLVADVILPRFGVSPDNIHKYKGRYDTFDLTFLPTQYKPEIDGKETAVEVKTRHVAKTGYTTCDIELDKYEAITANTYCVRQPTTLICLYTDYVVFFPADKVRDSYIRTTVRKAPQESSKGIWTKPDKTFAQLSFEHAKIYSYEFFNITCPEWVSKDPNKNRNQELNG